jgi:hypothetical protein
MGTGAGPGAGPGRAEQGRAECSVTARQSVSVYAREQSFDLKRTRFGAGQRARSAVHQQPNARARARARARWFERAQARHRPRPVFDVFAGEQHGAGPRLHQSDGAQRTAPPAAATATATATATASTTSATASAAHTKL